MADSNITKKALASALTELMDEVPFSKISVVDICERCDMNRKSFYYHFKDKYDLVNWIFDIGFVSTVAYAPDNAQWSPWDFCESLFGYLYENRSFYRMALCITGQNAFSEQFRESLYVIFSNKIPHLIEKTDNASFTANFFVDAFVCAVERWILDKNCMSPDEFLRNIRNCIRLCSDAEHISDNNTDGSE